MFVFFFFCGRLGERILLTVLLYCTCCWMLRVLFARGLFWYDTYHGHAVQVGNCCLVVFQDRLRHDEKLTYQGTYFITVSATESSTFFYRLRLVRCAPMLRNLAGRSNRVTKKKKRWVTCGDAGLRMFPDLAVAHQLGLSEHLRSWTDAARVCAMEADRQYVLPAGNNAQQAGPGNDGMTVGGNEGAAMANAYVVGGSQRNGAAGAAGQQPAVGARAEGPMAPAKRQKLRQRKKHCLPRSGLAGMLKFLGAPKEAALHGLTRRGMETVAGVAQCVACLVRIGVPFPVTARVTQLWGPGGKYEGTRYDELPLILLPAAPTPGSAGGAGASGSVGGGGERGGGQVWSASSPQQSQTRVAAASTTMNENNNRGGNRGGVASEPRKKTPKKNGFGGGGGGAPGGHGGGGVLVSHAGSKGAVESVPGGGGAAVGGEGAGAVQRGGKVPEWRKNMPIESLAPDYLDYFLRAKERQFYKSAGILPYR